MSQTRTSTPAQRSGPAASASRRGMLSRLVYRSRAVAKLDPPDLQMLAAASQARNSRERITGLMLFDDSRFYQWLEGPPDSVDRVMNSIRNDKRHTDIEVLSAEPSEQRRFGDWSMKLAAHVPPSACWRRDVIEPPREVVETLRRQPDAAPVLLVKLLPTDGQDRRPASSVTEAISQLPLRPKLTAGLKGIMLAQVVPLLAQQHGRSDVAGVRPPPPNPRAPELAQALVADDQNTAVELIRELQADQACSVPHYATLFEPAARRLGDMWGDDDCSEFDVTLGLCRLQTALRLLGGELRHTAAPHAPPPVVLVAPEPGELHRFGATLDCDVLWNAGWAPRCAYPDDDQGLTDLVATEWVDVLNLSLSAAFRRDHWQPRMSRTVAEARRASRNPDLVVLVSGRLFFEEGSTAGGVGADVATRTAWHLDQVILRALATATPSETRVALPTAS